MSKQVIRPHNSIMYDEKVYNSYLKTTVGPNNHHIFPSKFVNCGSCMVNDNVCSTDKQMNRENANLVAKKLDIENFLIGRLSNADTQRTLQKSFKEDTDPKLLPKELCSVVPNRQSLPTFYTDLNSCK